jgi:hypothetical protein
MYGSALVDSAERAFELARFEVGEMLNPRITELALASSNKLYGIQIGFQLKLIAS